MLPAYIVPSAWARMGRRQRNSGSASMERQRFWKRSSLIVRGFEGAGLSLIRGTASTLTWSFVGCLTTTVHLRSRTFGHRNGRLQLTWAGRYTTQSFLRQIHYNVITSHTQARCSAYDARRPLADVCRYR